MPYSPSGIFVGSSQAELDALRAAALEAIRTGQWTTVTGGQKTGSKEYQNPKETLIEVRYAEQQQAGRGRAQKVYQDLTPQPYPRDYYYGE